MALAWQPASLTTWLGENRPGSLKEQQLAGGDDEVLKIKLHRFTRHMCQRHAAAAGHQPRAHAVIAACCRAMQGHATSKSWIDTDHSDAEQQSSTVLRKRHCEDLGELESDSWVRGPM